MAHVVVPHFHIPFQMDGSRVRVNEQDSDHEITNTASTVLRYQPGDRIGLPEYGVPEQALRQGGVQMDHVQSIVEAWDDRASVEVFTTDTLADAIHEVNVQIGVDRG